METREAVVLNFRQPALLLKLQEQAFSCRVFGQHFCLLTIMHLSDLQR